MLSKLKCLMNGHRFVYRRNIRDDVRILFAFDGSTEVMCSRCNKTIYIKDYLVPSYTQHDYSVIHIVRGDSK